MLFRSSRQRRSRPLNLINKVSRPGRLAASSEWAVAAVQELTALSASAPADSIPGTAHILRFMVWGSIWWVNKRSNWVFTQGRGFSPLIPEDIAADLCGVKNK